MTEDTQKAVRAYLELAVIGGEKAKEEGILKNNPIAFAVGVATVDVCKGCLALIAELEKGAAE